MSKLGWTEKREYVNQMWPEIARYYYETGKSTKEVGLIYGVCRDVVRKCVNRYSKEEIKKIFNIEKEEIIVVAEKDIHHALMALSELGIHCRQPSEHHELTEYYESKINRNE